MTSSASAQWVDSHVPAHDAAEIADHGLEYPARSLYSNGSGFIHGYKWMVDYGRNGVVFTMIADALAVALNMVECAVCLFEAASRAPGGAQPDGSYVPERFEPTIAAWSAELFRIVVPNFAALVPRPAAHDLLGHQQQVREAQPTCVFWSGRS